MSTVLKGAGWETSFESPGRTLPAAHAEPAVEPFNPSLGVHDALLAREERVALLADLHVQLALWSIPSCTTCRTSS